MGVVNDIVAERYGPEKKTAPDMLGSFVANGLTQEEAESETTTQMRVPHECLSDLANYVIVLLALILRQLSYDPLSSTLSQALQFLRNSAPNLPPIQFPPRSRTQKPGNSPICKRYSKKAYVSTLRSPALYQKWFLPVAILSRGSSSQKGLASAIVPLASSETSSFGEKTPMLFDRRDGLRANLRRSRSWKTCWI
jgi:hypothetical protein